MSEPNAIAAEASREARPSGSARKQIRGSTLLLLGRCVGLLINLAVQVIAIRYLAKEDFGAFAFGLTMVALGTQLSLLGLTKSLSRFVPLYHERGDRPRMAGSAVLMLVTAVGLGLAVVAIVFGARSIMASHITSDPLSLSLLLLMIVLVPIDAIDRLMESFFAAFGYVRSIFVRRHLIGPSLKLTAVLAVVLTGGGVRSLAICYVVAGVVGVLLYSSLLKQLLVREKLLPYFHPRRWKVPAGEVFRFSLPLFSSQIGFVVRTSVAVLLLEIMRGNESVADLRAVFPFARLNEVVIASFAFLFTPLASRMFARQETEGIDHLYWRTSVWILALTMPLYLITGVLAEPFTQLVLGDRYASAAPILFVLATGFFVEAVLGFNVHALRVFAKVRQIVVIDIVTIVTALSLALLLIPRAGAFGAAIAMASAMLIQSLLFQIAMRVSTGVGKLHWPYVRFYGLALSVTVALTVIQWNWKPPLAIGLVMVLTCYAVLMASHRSLLEIPETFPELCRIPILGRWLAEPGLDLKIGLPKEPGRTI